MRTLGFFSPNGPDQPTNRGYRPYSPTCSASVMANWFESVEAMGLFGRALKKHSSGSGSSGGAISLMELKSFWKTFGKTASTYFLWMD